MELTKRAKQALETRQRILEHALEMFSEKGYDNVTIEEIAKQAGVSKGTFYVHFAAKYDIFIEKFKEFDAYYTAFVEEIPAHWTAGEKILRFYEMQMIFLRDTVGFDLLRTVYSNALSQTIEKNHYLVDQNRNLYRTVRQFIEEGYNAGEFIEKYSVDEISFYINRCMRGTIYDWIIYQDEMDLVEDMLRFTSVFLRGIQK